MISKDIYTSVEMTKSERYLHTPGNFARQNLLYVQEVGMLESLKPHRSIRENLDSFLLLIVMEGKGVLAFGEKEITVQKGDCAFIDCMEHYEHISDEEESWKLAWVHFNGKNARVFYDLFSKNNNSGEIFHVDNLEEWTSAIRRLMEHQVEKNILSEMECGELLLHLLNMAMRSVMPSASYSNEQGTILASQIRDYINEWFVKKDILELLTDEFDQNASELKKSFQDAYGIGIEGYISNRRYNAAKELLRFSVRTMEDIAQESGIGDVILMQQLFIQNEGMTAEEYRQKWAGWIRG